MLEKPKFRIISDMVRKEDNEMNYLAGIDFLNSLYNDYKYPFETLIFCGDI